MGELYREADASKIPRALAAPVPMHQKQKLEQAEWSRKGASLKKLAVLLDRDVKAFYTTRSDLQQVCLEKPSGTMIAARLSNDCNGAQQGSGGYSVACGLVASADLQARPRLLRSPVGRLFVPPSKRTPEQQAEINS